MDKKEKNKLVVPIICLLISIGLWVYVTNVENKIRTTEISKIPVELINSDALTSSKLALSPNQEFYVTLKVEGNTNDINKIKKSDFKVQVDLSEYVWKKGENKVPVSIVDYPITVSIRSTNTLTVSINIEDMVEKTMPITSNINVTPKSGYFASEPTITPEEVTVTGAESLVNQVSKLVVTDTKEGVNEDIVDNYRIIPVNESGNEVTGVNLSEETAKVEIKISKGKSVKINVATVGELPSNMKLESIESSRKTVELIGPTEILDTINELSTTAIDLSSITGNQDVNLSIIIPDGVSVAQGEEMLTARVNVISMTTKEFSVKLNITGITDGLNVLPNKENIKVTIKGFEDELANVTEENIITSLDVSTYKEEGTFDVEPKVTLKDLSGDLSIEAVEHVTLTVSKEIAQGSQDNSSTDSTDSNNSNSNESTGE
jgi:YbbR domain-containing protein